MIKKPAFLSASVYVLVSETQVRDQLSRQVSGHGFLRGGREQFLCKAGGLSVGTKYFGIKGVTLQQSRYVGDVRFWEGLRQLDHCDSGIDEAW
jgi:hypothetical protein